MSIHLSSKGWLLAGLLAGTGACSLVVDLSDLSQGTSSSSGTASGSSSGGAGGTRSTDGTGGASSSTSATGGAATSSTTSSSSSGTPSDCTGPGFKYNSMTGHCYRIDTDPSRRWSVAQDWCSTWGGHLVVIEDQTEASWLYSNFPLLPDTWIGLSDQAQPGDYLWVTGPSLSATTYTNWASTFPKDTQGNCINLDVNLKWANAICTATRNTLCEKP